MGVRRDQVAVAAGCVLAALLPAVAVLPGSAVGPDGATTRSFPGGAGLVAFVSDRDENHEIYVMAPDGTGQRRLTATSDAAESSPAWSPDGSRLAYAREEGDGASLWVLDVVGGSPLRLTGAGAADRHPTWSPTGGEIAFETDRGAADSEIWVVDADGAGPPRPVPMPGTTAARDPSWSPDGELIAFSGTTSDPGAEAIYVGDAEGGTEPRRVTSPGGAADRHPDWSPDGRRLAFVRFPGVLGDIHTIAPDGSSPRQLTSGGLSETRPAWSPDGRSIAFQNGFPGELSLFTLWTMAADGTGPRTQRAAGGGSFDGEPSWQPRPVSVLEVDPPSAAGVVGDRTTVQVTALDADGEPLAWQRVLLRVTGPHARTVRLVTDAAGRASHTWEGTDVGTDSVLACWDPQDDGTCQPTEPADTASILWTLAEHPRLAFTDDADALHTIEVVRQEDGGLQQADGGTSYATTLRDFEAGPDHEGEAGGAPGRPPAFVSTRNNRNGEVYLASDDADRATRITCDPGTESHPVVNTNGTVAYASDADGDWDIYVSDPRPFSAPARVAPFGRSAVPGEGGRAAATAATACRAGWTTVNVTDELDGAPPTDELWPTWTYGVSTLDGTATVFPTGLVFSRAAAGGLPDLYRAAVGDSPFSTPVAGAPEALTDTPGVAETQPAAMALRVRTNPECAPTCGATFAVRGWVAFSTSESRSAGTIALLSLDGPPRTIYPGDRLEGGEPAWSSVVNPDDLAVTSTDEDPYGDVAIAEVDAPLLVGSAPGDPVVRGFDVVAHGPTGTAQSHPHWLEGFGSEGGDATLVVTTRSSGWVGPGSRVLDADVSDVHAPDGTQRRVLRRERALDDGEVVFRYDEAGPAYSPDGRRLVYSRVVGPDDASGARLLMVANADGTGAVPLLPPGEREPRDLDVDPAWSPDGRRIAFVRITGREPEGSPTPPEVHVYDVVTGTLTPVPAGAGVGDADLSPSWAPDSTHLVLARSSSGIDGPLDAARRWETTPRASRPELLVADTSRPLDPAVELDTCDDGCSVQGRSPAWSPDGTTIAYEYDGQLRTVALEESCCDGTDIAAAPPLTLVGADRATDELTDSRTLVATAQDPAWSPDGSELAFTGQPVGRPDHRGIWRIATDGSDPEVVTDEPGPESEPAWQPVREADVAVTVSVTGSPAMLDEPVVATFTVTNLGPRPAPLVSLDTAFAAGGVTIAPGAPAGCRANGTGCDLPVLAPGESRVYAVRVRHPARVLGTATGTVTADAPDPDLTNNTATAPYRVMGADVAVEIGLDAPIGYVGGRRFARVAVRNVGVDPVEDVEVRAVWPAAVVAFEPALLPPPASPPAPACLVAGATCMLGTLGPGERRTFRVEVRTPTEGSTVLAAEVSTSTPEADVENNRDEIELEILQPELRLLPSVAPPGKVVLAYGERFPPGSRVTLTWDPGITAIRGSFGVAPDGTFRVPVLVIRRDLLGERVLLATSTTALFAPPVDGDLLVVPRTLAPPSFNGRG